MRTSRRFKRILIAAVVVSAFFGFVFGIESFLACNHPVSAPILVVEGWFPNRRGGLEEAAEIIRQREFRVILCVATETEENNAAPDAVSPARQTAQRLVRLGVDPQKIVILSLENVHDDRTLNLALATKDWLKQNAPEVHALDVFTMGFHARKSQIIFRKTVPAGVAVGVFSGRGADFPLSRWYLYPRGIYLVLRNTVGWVYAVCVSPLSSSPGVKAHQELLQR